MVSHIYQICPKFPMKMIFFFQFKGARLSPNRAPPPPTPPPPEPLLNHSMLFVLVAATRTNNMEWLRRGSGGGGGGARLGLKHNNKITNRTKHNNYYVLSCWLSYCCVWCILFGIVITSPMKREACYEGPAKSSVTNRLPWFYPRYILKCFTALEWCV